jgi:hypothetical protein
MRATYTRTAGVRHLFAAYELREDKLFGHVKPRKKPAPEHGQGQPPRVTRTCARCPRWPG